jgi:chromosome partitioning protein
VGIDVLASHVLLAAIEEALEPGDELKLSDLLTPLKPTYDFILVDSPPGKAMLAFNGLAAADLIVIPASAERMAVDGVADLITHVQKIMWNKFSLTHQERWILFTMYRDDVSLPAILLNAKKIWRDNVLNVKIPHSTVFSRSYDQKLPVAVLEPRHQGPSHITCLPTGSSTMKNRALKISIQQPLLPLGSPLEGMPAIQSPKN